MIKRKVTLDPYPDDSLRGLLKKKDRRLFENLEKNWEASKRALLDYVTEADFTSHGLSHCEGIESKLEELIPHKVKHKMAAIEIYILLHGVLYHDIGMASRLYPDEPLNLRRQNHAERSASIIKEKYLDLGILDRAIAFRIADVARGHGTSTIDEFDDDDFLEGYGALDVKFLVALLRLGDMLDWSKSRAPLIMGDIEWISGESYKYWLEHNLIESIRPRPDRNMIVITAVPKGDWTERWVKKVTEWMNTELHLVRDTFRKRGINYGTFELKLREDELEKYRPDRKGDNPFQLLQFYDDKTRDIFFERDQEIDEFIGKLFANRVNILLGESGVGKTSFLLAGVRPAMKELSFSTVYMDDYIVAVEGLTQRLHSEIPLSFHGVRESLQSLRLATTHKKRTLLIFDQFEKNFGSEYDNSFLSLLADIITANDIETRIVISLRRDFLDDLWQFSNDFKLGLFEQEHRTRIYRPDAATAKRILEKTAAAADIVFEEKVTDAIVDDLLSMQKTDTVFFPDLQIACGTFVEYLFENKIPKATSSEYERLGGAEELVASYFREKMWKGFIDSEVPVARRLISALVDFYGTRLQRPLAEISQEVGCTTDEAQRIISQLIDKRLIRRVVDEPDHSQVRYELIHDFLAKTVNENLSEEEKSEKSALESWEACKRDWERESLPMGEARLKFLGPYVHALSLSDSEKAMILQNLENEDYIDTYWCRVFDDAWIERIFSLLLKSTSSIADEEGNESIGIFLRDSISSWSVSSEGPSNWSDTFSFRNIIIRPAEVRSKYTKYETIVQPITFTSMTASTGIVGGFGKPAFSKTASVYVIKFRFYARLLNSIGSKCMPMLERKLEFILNDYNSFAEDHKCTVLSREACFWATCALMYSIDMERTFRELVRDHSPSLDNEGQTLVLQAILLCLEPNIWSVLTRHEFRKIAETANAKQLLYLCEFLMLSEKKKDTWSDLVTNYLAKRIASLEEPEKIEIFSDDRYRNILAALDIREPTALAIGSFREAKKARERLKILRKGIVSGRVTASALVLEGLDDNRISVKQEAAKIAGKLKIGSALPRLLELYSKAKDAELEKIGSAIKEIDPEIELPQIKHTPYQIALEKELSDYLSRKYGARIKIVSPIMPARKPPSGTE